MPSHPRSCRDRSRSTLRHRLQTRGIRVRRASSVRRRTSYECEGRSPARLRRRRLLRGARTVRVFLRGSLTKSAVFVDEEIEMCAFFVGKLEKNAFAFGVFKALAVFLE